MTVYGQGYIEAVRAEGNLVVKLNEWALAQGQSPTLYLRYNFDICLLFFLSFRTNTDQTNSNYFIKAQAPASRSLA